MNNPLIGITCDYEEINGQPSFFIKKSYVAAVEDAGGIPLLLCPTRSEAAISRFISLIDGLLISGGGFDIDPKFYGEKPHPKLGKTIPERTDFEFELLKSAVKKKMPVLGICGGHQLINVYFGGTLYQDIQSQHKGAVNHKQSIPSDKPHHGIKIYPSTRLSNIIGADSIMVNSTHHQSIKKAADRFKTSAVAEDGIIEAIEYNGKAFIMGVQWHPENLCHNEPRFKKIFIEFMAESKKFGLRKSRI
ncbi:MAG: gamma-glutamyl-gamma-aminobutyrate hydrolase family protein [Nitrospinae bacterium]|nr:gamma-glutamyl-gamma-aminobutyrate hydrolase family protein [Nitrospinota bacterium]MBI3815864.1 gamma-glutamyl-gamma-aminobutyrate hydrolase family protein [Nitrospinota bacterium]